LVKINWGGEGQSSKEKGGQCTPKEKGGASLLEEKINKVSKVAGGPKLINGGIQRWKTKHPDDTGLVGVQLGPLCGSTFFLWGCESRLIYTEDNGGLTDRFCQINYFKKSRKSPGNTE